MNHQSVAACSTYTVRGRGVRCLALNLDSDWSRGLSYHSPLGESLTRGRPALDVGMSSGDK